MVRSLSSDTKSGLLKSKQSWFSEPLTHDDAGLRGRFMVETLNTRISSEVFVNRQFVTSCGHTRRSFRDRVL